MNWFQPPLPIVGARVIELLNAPATRGLTQRNVSRDADIRRRWQQGGVTRLKLAKDNRLTLGRVYQILRGLRK